MDIVKKLQQIDPKVEILNSVSTISNQEINLTTVRSGSLNMIFTCPSSAHALILSQSTMAFVFKVQIANAAQGRNFIRFQPNFTGNIIQSFTLSVNNLESNNISRISDNSNVAALLNFNNSINLDQSQFNEIASISDCNFIAVPGEEGYPGRVGGQGNIVDLDPINYPNAGGFLNASIIKNPGRVIPYLAGTYEIITYMNISNICSLANNLNLIGGMISFNISFSFQPEWVYQALDPTANPPVYIPQNTTFTLSRVDLYASLAKFSESIPAGISFRGLGVQSAVLPNTWELTLTQDQNTSQMIFSNNISLAPNKIQYIVFYPYISEVIGNPQYRYYPRYANYRANQANALEFDRPYTVSKNGDSIGNELNFSMPSIIFGGTQKLHSNNLLVYEPGPDQSLDNYLFSFIRGYSVYNDGSSSKSCFPFNIYNQDKFMIFDASKVDFSAYQNQIAFSVKINTAYVTNTPGTLKLRFLYYIFSEKIYT